MTHSIEINRNQSKLVSKASAAFKAQAPIFKGELIGAGMNAKTVKGDKLTDYQTAIMYLLPADSVEGVNLCPMAVTAGCKAGCLVSAGRGRFTSVHAARERKTKLYRDNRERFLATLVRDIERFEAHCNRHGVKPAIRLNGTSDIQFERGHHVTRAGKVYPSIMHAFPNVQFYDYTKNYGRVYRALPANYHLTLSYSEANEAYAAAILKAVKDTGTNMAVVYRTKAHVQARVNGMANVIDGDVTDLRFTDDVTGGIVALYAKGMAKHDDSGFVID